MTLVSSPLLDSLRLDRRLAGVLERAAPRRHGRVVSVRGLSIVIRGLAVRIGELVTIGSDDSLLAEVVAVEGDRASCLPLGSLDGIGGGDRVTATGEPLRIAVGEELRGRVLDGLGRPLDEAAGQLGRGLERVSVELGPPPALQRQAVDVPIGVGVRAIDTLTPIGRGQRVGIFAGSGVGKSSLLSMITRGTTAKLTVVALIGERGREVNDFLDHSLGPEGLKNAIVVVATSDQPPMVRLRAAFVATRIAEHFRDAGEDVLLLMDSITRLAMAQREVGLSVGEPPATRGYPPSVFAALPRLVERAGNDAGAGSITAMYTVLAEGDDLSDPFVDAARAALDGHIVLSRKLASSGHFPAIDVLASISRVMTDVTSAEHRRLALEAREVLASYKEAADLIEVGAYVAGSNPKVDRAMRSVHLVNALFRQGPQEKYTLRARWTA